MGNRSRKSPEQKPQEGYELDVGPEHSPFTIEGQIEAYGRFARGAYRATGSRGLLARIIVWMFLLGFVISIVGGIIQLLDNFL